MHNSQKQTSRQSTVSHWGVLSLLLGLVLTTPLAAQTASVTGRISDDVTGAALPGASISVAGTTVQTVSDRQGSFTLGSLPPGEHVLTITYLGYDGATRTISLQAGERTVVNVTLTGNIIELDPFIVASIREGQSRALNQQRAADTISNIVASDSIGNFPDPNIAEALQRIAAISVERDQGEGRFVNVRGAPAEFTAVTIDGISIPSPEPSTRAIELDTIPTDVVAGLEVTKALRPDQDADSIAGAVNIITQSAFDAGRRIIRGSIGTGYNDFGGTNDTRANFSYADLFDDGRWGLVLSAAYSKTRREVDNIETDWVKVGNTWVNEEFVFKDYETRRTRTSFTAQLEHRPDTSSRYFVRGTFSKFEDNEFRYRLDSLLSDGTLQPGFTDRAATWTNTRIERQFRHRVRTNEIWNIAAGGQNDFDRYAIDYAVSFSEASQTYPIRDELRFRSSLRPTVSYDFGPNRDEPTITLFQTNQHLDESRYAFREFTQRRQDSTEEELSAQANLTVRTDLLNNPGQLKFGVKLRNRDKESDNEQWRDRRGSSAPSQPFSEFLRDVDSRNYGYFLGRKFEPSQVESFFRQARPLQGAATLRVANSIVSDYTASEDILAAYGMARMDVGELDILTGVRVEQTKLKSSAFLFDEGNQTAVPVSANRSYTQFFPGIHFKYSFDPNLIGRAAITTGTSRPAFTNTVPALSINEDDGTISGGNPGLKAAYATNLDLFLEYYFEPLGLVSGGVFYKDIKNYLFTGTSRVVGGEFDGFRQTRPENAGGGSIAGVEFSWQQGLTFLPGALSGFGLYGNITYTDSSVKLPLSGEKIRMPGQSDLTYNLSVYYERAGFSARLSYTGRTEYLSEVDGAGREFDLYWDGRDQLDFTTTYQFTRRVTAFLEFTNLTNSKGVRYIGSRDRPYEVEAFGWRGFGGIRINL